MPDLDYGGYTIGKIADGVAMVESSGGKNIGPRYEVGFQKKYLEGKEPWESLSKKYGWKAVSSSYGKFQIMFPVAYELGYRGTPQGLADPEVNRQFFEKKFLRDYEKTGGDLDKTFLRYNGGGDKLYPSKVRKYLDMDRVSKNSQPLDAPVSDPIMGELERINGAMMAAGFNRPLNVDEIEPIIASMVPATPLNGAIEKRNKVPSGLNDSIPMMGGMA
jgi:hypothetical protein